MDTPVLAVRHVSKSFAGVRALVDIDLEIAPGEIHCLAGENGSGKSTLIKVISGVHTPEHGTVSIDGRDFTRLTPAAAIDAGVRVIYQDFSIFPNLSVMENIALGSEVAAGRRLVNRSRMREVAREAVAKIGFQVDLDELVGNLSVADKQLVAISRALMGDAKLIIMDEPTTALTKKEVAALFDIVRDLQSRGIAILFVSHKLEEVFEIAQRFTILRSGHKVITCPKEELDRASFARYMTGRDFAEERYQPGTIDEAPVLQVEGATVSGAFADASLSVRPGEILGITGLLGSGRTELALSLFGMLPLDSGCIRVKGQDVTLRGVRDAIEAGIAYVPEDRLTEGLFLSRSIGENITISEMENFTKVLGFIDKKAIRAEEQKWVTRLEVVTPDPANAVNTLSGGNQQKVVLAKWLATKPSVLILNGPTVGVDIGSKFTIHSILRELASQGMAVIIISDDIAEVLTNCSTIAIMRAGHLSEAMSPDTLTEAELTRLLSEDRAPASSLRREAKPGHSQPQPRQSAARHERRPGDFLEGEGVAARHIAHGRGDDVHLAARDRRVGRHPRVVLPLGGRPLLARLVRLLDGFAHVGDGPTLHAGEDCGDLVEGQGLGARHVESLILVAPRIRQDAGCHAPRVLARDHADSPVACGPEDAALLIGQRHEKVRVEVIAQERVRHARRLDVLLRVEVCARQRERCIGSRVNKRQVHDVAHPGCGRRVDERDVLVQAVLALGRGHHEEDVNAFQRDARRERVLVRALHRDGSRQLGRARRRVREQAQG